ncbi:MAG: DUF2877 domain-containing protein [Candidatus Riflebacteria bacterium]|nr:DUF2877 domain-containing protein [Candidatus Riflebacteria bacterium]
MNEFNFRSDSLLKTGMILQGHVCAIFQNSFDAAMENGFLLHFTTHTDRMHPLSVRLSCLPELIHKGSRVQFSGNFLTLSSDRNYIAEILNPDRRKNFTDIFRYTLAKEFIAISELPDHSETFNFQKTSEVLARYIRCFGKHSEICESIFSDKQSVFSEYIADISKKIQNKSTVNLMEYMAHFGSGEGLTPAWDDFCVGIMLVDFRMKNKLICLSNNFFEILRRKTTEVSYWQVIFAHSGKSSLIFEKLADMIVSGFLQKKEILSALNTGHTSGTDILSGMYLRLSGT